MDIARGERHAAFVSYQKAVSLLRVLLSPTEETPGERCMEELSPAAVISVLRKRKREIEQENDKTRKKMMKTKAMLQTSDSGGVEAADAK
jgi:hypothetical protein